MSELNKNNKKISLKSLLTDSDSVWVFLSKSLIILTILPTIFAGLLLIQNFNYKKQVSELSVRVSSQSDSINNLVANNDLFSNQIASMKIELDKYQQETSEIEARYKELKKEHNDKEISILNDIKNIRKNIYSLNNQLKIIEKRLSPKNKAKENN